MKKNISDIVSALPMKIWGHNFRMVRTNNDLWEVGYFKEFDNHGKCDGDWFFKVSGTDLYGLLDKTKSFVESKNY